METNFDTPAQPKEWQKETPVNRGGKWFLSLFSNRFWHTFLLVNVAIALLYLLINLSVSWGWINTNFAGFMHQNRVVTHSNLPGWETHEAKIGAVHLEEGDIIAEVNGVPLQSSRQLIEYARQQKLGYPVNYLLLTIVALSSENPSPQTIPVSRFSTLNFIQLVAIPAFIAFISLIIVGSVAYLRSYRLQVKVFAFFTLAMVYFLVSFSEFIVSEFYVINFTLAFVGKITMPVFLLHFLLLFPRPHKVLKTWPFLLPLIYLPVLPALIHIPYLFTYPENTRYFSILIEAYTALYALIGLVLLAQVIVKDNFAPARKQASVLFAGLILPVLLMTGLSWTNSGLDYEMFHTILGHYGFIGVPIAVAVAVIRFELFGIRHTNRSHFYFMVAIIVALVGYFILLALISSISVNIRQFFSGDLLIIIITIPVFYAVRPIYSKTRDWIKQRVYGNIEDFRVGLRIFSHELVKTRSRRDLEALISWEIVSDFRLESAELVANNRPTIPYALSLPLTVSNVSLGTLFLGAKINGKDFTEEEMVYLTELQKQLSLALWSIELDQAIQATEQLTRLKSKFLAHVTHELRAPLNGIINFIGFVLDDYRNQLNREQIDHLEQALNSGERLLEIINNILDMSKIEVGQMVIHPQSTNLADVVDETSHLIEQMVVGRPIEFVTDISPNLPNVYSDRLRLRQIIYNMLSNAAKFTRAGTIRLSAYPDNGNVIIQVADTGVGINQQRLPTIFEQFVSTGLADAGHQHGPGLSMPITKSLVELHGGQVNVESHLGQGTTFTVTLPVHPEL